MIEVRQYDRTGETNVYLFHLENRYAKIGILNFGGIIKYYKLKFHCGEKNIVFGIESIEEYIREGNYSSAVIGRVANRIKNGMFSMNGKSESVTRNDGKHTNHGGMEVMWMDLTSLSYRQIKPFNIISHMPLVIWSKWYQKYHIFF